MITIFCDFRRFSLIVVKNSGVFFLKTDVIIQFFKKLAVFLTKSVMLSTNSFGENIFTNTTSVSAMLMEYLGLETVNSIMRCMYVVIFMPYH
jgi:hypothetical protein